MYLAGNREKVVFFLDSDVKGSGNPVVLPRKFAHDMQLVKLYLEMEKVKSRMWFFNFKDL